MALDCTLLCSCAAHCPPPFYEQVLQTAQASAGPAHVTSRQAPPQSQAPTRAITRDVSTTDRRFEGCESNNAIMTSQNRAVTPRLAEVISPYKSMEGRDHLPPNTPSADPQLSSFMDSSKRSESHSFHAAVARGDRQLSADAAFLWATS